jgi:DNA polymerase III alpha subunit
MENKANPKLAIRFGISAIKAVGMKMIEDVIIEREKNGQFKNIFDFVERVEGKYINKKTIEALSKSGSFDCIANNRRQIFDSFDIISAYASQKKEEISSDQMSLFSSDSVIHQKPELKKISDWDKSEKLKKEFEAFGFFLNEHPLDQFIDDLKKRGVIFSNRILEDDLLDNSSLKMSGVVISSKHRSGSKGRFAYLNISDPFGIFELMIFDENLINSARDIIADGSNITIECLIKKDDGGVRILAREIYLTDNFIKNNPAKDKFFEDIKIIKSKKFNKNNNVKDSSNNNLAEKNAENFTQKLDEKIDKSENKQVNKDNLKAQIIKISIDSREAIIALKALLSQYKTEDKVKYCSVIIEVVKDQFSSTKILLKDKYSISETEILRLKKIDKIISVLIEN